MQMNKGDLIVENFGAIRRYRQPESCIAEFPLREVDYWAPIASTPKR